MGERLKIKFKLIQEEAKLPEYKHSGDAAFDIYSSQDLIINPGNRSAVSTGIASEFPRGWVVEFKDRSGLALDNGIHVLAGVIDSNYRGEWKVILINLSDEDFKIDIGDRIAQGIFREAPEVEIIQVDELSENTDRGDKGFGSSGKK